MKHKAVVPCFVLAVLASPPPASADDARDACVAAHEQSQLARHAGDLVRARQQLRLCARAACPSLVRNDCVTWLEQVDQSFPTVVVRAERDGADVADVRVTVDGKMVTSRLDGKAIELTPGEHLFHFDLEGVPSVTQTVLAREGEKDRPVVARFAPSHASSATRAVSAREPQARPTPLGAYLLGGVGLAGFAGFGVAAGIGKAEESSLRTSCAPRCAASSVDGVRTKFLVADLALGIGAASLVAATVWYLVRPTGQADVPVPPVDVAPVESGAAVRWRGSF